MFVEKLERYNLAHFWCGGEAKGIHTFTRGISPKVNVMAWQGFELAYFEVAVQRFSHFVTGSPHPHFRRLAVTSVKNH